MPESVVNAHRREIMKNLERSIKGIPLNKRMKDWWLQAFQLNKCYIPHWDEIKDVFSDFEVDLNRSGPILTLQTLKQVRMAKELTFYLKENPEIRRMARQNIIPLKSVYSESDYDPEKIVDGVIFVTLLRVIPDFCLILGAECLKDFLLNGGCEKHLKRVFEAQPKDTILNTQKEIEDIIRLMTEDVKKHEKKG